jgi:hypothetical protein
VISPGRSRSLSRCRSHKSRHTKDEARRIELCLVAAAAGSSDMVANARVDRIELRSDKRHGANAHDRDQRGDQAIFNGRDARFVSKKTGEEIFIEQVSEL